MSRIFQSPPFTFIVGADKTKFTVHAAVIAQQCSALNKLINAPGAGASSRTAVLENIEPSTFERFCQFAYFGDYEPVGLRKAVSRTIMGRTKRKKSNPSEAKMPHIGIESSPPPSACWAPRKKKKTYQKNEQSNQDIYDYKESVQKSGMREVLLKKFQKRTYRTKAHWQSILSTRPTLGNNSDEENFTPILLGYAHLYSLGDRWNLPTFKTLTLSKIHQILSAFNMTPARVGAVVALIRWAYNNDNTLDLVEIDQLRELVASFAACQDDVLLLAPKFVELVEEGGHFAEVFHQMMRPRYRV